MVFGVTLKKITVSSWHFMIIIVHIMIIIAFSIHDIIFKIFWLVLSGLQTFSDVNFFSFFFFYNIMLIQFYSLGQKAWKFNTGLLIYFYNDS